MKDVPITGTLPIALATPSADEKASVRCLRCHRPQQLCFCDAIPQVLNRTEVMILQHRRERAHPFNTARIVKQSLQRCQLFADHNDALAARMESIELSPNAGLLYPGEDAQLLTELEQHELPDQLVILDGTWHHAKTLMRDIPRLHCLPQFRLLPSAPGRYRIRREPNEHALSTLEATVQALQVLEPQTCGFDQLLVAFDQMIDSQLTHGTANWRQNQRRRRGSPNVPRILTNDRLDRDQANSGGCNGDQSNIVVCYGELSFGNGTKRGQAETRGGGSTDQVSTSNRSEPGLVYWTAERLVSGETFRCAIESQSLRDSHFLVRLRLPADEVKAAVPVQEFLTHWRTFLRPTDHLAVYHQSTFRELKRLDEYTRPALILKSINLADQAKSGTLEQILCSRGIPTYPADDSRAAARLANAVALVRYLVHCHS